MVTMSVRTNARETDNFRERKIIVASEPKEESWNNCKMVLLCTSAATVVVGVVISKLLR